MNRVTLAVLSEYIVAHPDVRTLLVAPRTFLEILQLVNPSMTSVDASGEFIKFHWIVVRPDVGFQIADESELRKEAV